MLTLPGQQWPWTQEISIGACWLLSICQRCLLPRHDVTGIWAPAAVGTSRWHRICCVWPCLALHLRFLAMSGAGWWSFEYPADVPIQGSHRSRNPGKLLDFRKTFPGLEKCLKFKIAWNMLEKCLNFVLSAWKLLEFENCNYLCNFFWRLRRKRWNIGIMLIL